MVDESCSTPLHGERCEGVCYEGPKNYMEGCMMGTRFPRVVSPIAKVLVPHPMYLRSTSCAQLGFFYEKHVPDRYYGPKGSISMYMSHIYYDQSIMQILRKSPAAEGWND